MVAVASELAITTSNRFHFALSRVGISLSIVTVLLLSIDQTVEVKPHSAVPNGRRRARRRNFPDGGFQQNRIFFRLSKERR